MALAAALGLFEIGAKSLWRDEGYSVLVAGLDLPGVWRVISPREANGGLYYLLLHAWMVVGSSEGIVRSLSTVFAVATVPVLYALALRLFDRRHAAVATLLFAVNAFVVRYAQEARGYTLVLFLVTAASYLLLRALDAPSMRSWTAFAVLGALSVYAHFFAGLVLAAHFAFAMSFAGRRKVSRRAIAATFALIAVLVSPLLVPVTSVSHLNWLDTPTLRDFVGTFQSLAGAGGAALLGAYFAICSVALVAAVRRARGAEGRDAAWRWAFLLSWLFVPIVASFLFSVLAKPVFTPRYLIVSLPPLVLLAAAGVESIAGAWLRRSALALLVALSVRGLALWYSGYPKEDFRAAATYIVARAEPGDGIAFHSVGTRAPFDYYVRAQHAAGKVPEPVRPSAQWGAMDPLGEESAGAFDEWIAGSRDAHPRLWLVLKSPLTLSSKFESRYCPVERRSFSGIHVLLYGRGPCEPRPLDVAHAPTRSEP